MNFKLQKSILVIMSVIQYLTRLQQSGAKEQKGIHSTLYKDCPKHNGAKVTPNGKAIHASAPQSPS